MLWDVTDKDTDNLTLEMLRALQGINGVPGSPLANPPSDIPLLVARSRSICRWYLTAAALTVYGLPLHVVNSNSEWYFYLLILLCIWKWISSERYYGHLFHILRNLQQECEFVNIYVYFLSFLFSSHYLYESTSKKGHKFLCQKSVQILCTEIDCIVILKNYFRKLTL